MIWPLSKKQAIKESDRRSMKAIWRGRDDLFAVGDYEDLPKIYDHKKCYWSEITKAQIEIN